MTCSVLRPQAASGRPSVPITTAVADSAWLSAATTPGTPSAQGGTGEYLLLVDDALNRAELIGGQFVDDSTGDSDERCVGGHLQDREPEGVAG